MSWGMPRDERRFGGIPKRWVIVIASLFLISSTFAINITINSEVPITKGADSCTLNCQPTITDIQDANGTSITALRAGQTIWIIGTNFNTATAVYFKRNLPADGFQIDSDTKIIATIPSAIQPNPGESSSPLTISISVVASGGRSFPNSQIVTVTL